MSEETFGKSKGIRPQGLSIWESVEWHGWSETSSGCWEFAGSRVTRNYGGMKFGGKMYRVSRVSYAHHYGNIPDGLLVRHKCDNPPCINPDHLEIGTAGDNNRDTKSRGRQARGSAIPKAKLNESQVREIKMFLASESRQSYSAIGRMYGVGLRAIKLIDRGETWRHVQ